MGPSTSPHNARRSERTRTPAQLTKPELLRRLDERSRRHYGQPFTEGVLNDLIKDGLLPALKRSGNEGLKPVYQGGASHYRRALQIKRLMSRGMRGRDTLRIQLFLRGYGAEPWEVRDALRREYAKHLRSASAQVRSTYLDNDRRIGSAHKTSLREQMGPLDTRLRAAGLEVTPDTYIQWCRAARLPSGTNSLLAGWLFVDPESHGLSDHVEEALSQPDAKYLEAREAFRWVDRRCYLPILGVRIIDDPNFATIVFIKMLEFKRHGFPWKLALRTIPQLFITKFLDAIGHGRKRS